MRRDFCAALLAFATMMIGCQPAGPPKPMTNDRLDLLSRTGMSWASLAAPGGPSHLPISGDKMREIIRSLYPITATIEQPLIGEHYKFTYQAGMDPTSFTVDASADDHLVFQWGQFVYTGGNVTRFRQAVSSISAPEPVDTKDGGPSR